MRSWMMKLMGLPSCEEITEFSYAYLEETLDPNLKDKFERHLKGCGTCRRFVESYRAVAKPTRLSEPVPLDPDFEWKVAEFLKNEARRANQ